MIYALWPEIFWGVIFEGYLISRQTICILLPFYRLSNIYLLLAKCDPFQIGRLSAQRAGNSFALFYSSLFRGAHNILLSDLDKFLGHPVYPHALVSPSFAYSARSLTHIRKTALLSLLRPPSQFFQASCIKSTSLLNAHLYLSRAVWSEYLITAHILHIANCAGFYSWYSFTATTLSIFLHSTIFGRYFLQLIMH